MEPKMRRSGQALTREEALDILRRSVYGVLGLVDTAGRPYTVPLHFVLEDEHLYFHCAENGYKTDCIRHNSRVSVSVVEKSVAVPQISSTDYRSATARGRVQILTQKAKKRHVLELLLQKFCADFFEEGRREIDGVLAKTCIAEITLEEISGKQASPKTREAAKKEPAETER